MRIRLRNLRLRKHLSMLDLAVKASVSKSTISRIESGDMIPSIDILCRLCIALDVNICDMVDCERGLDDDVW